MTSFDPSVTPSTSPSLALGDTRSSRYPNPFFDISQQYMPPTIKELFRWCTFYFYNSPLIGSAIKKVSRYPITDLIYEDEHESVRDLWKKVFDDTLKIKMRLMEVNLDRHCYGNAFVSLHLPFTRFLICKECKDRQPIQQWQWQFQMSTYSFRGTCPSCNYDGTVDVKDVAIKDLKKVKLIRWNPENMQVKFNEYTGRYVYMYTVPVKLRNAIQRGDKDILEDIPLIVLEAVEKRRMIRFSDDNIVHLKNSTLAEQDQGWGKPSIIHVLKDMYYFYTLRRAQEAIALEHIVPFDIIYPLPNAQQDPYVHTDLGSWRSRIEETIKKHRRDPNFKAVLPIPIGFGRLGGDGKALLLSPELNYLTQTVVGGMGIPQEFLFGGLNYTGSSISLRTLENDFIQNRAELLDLCYWIKTKLRSWMSLPDIKSMRFADFRMADDIQKNQQLIGLNAQGKVSDQTLLTELGYDYTEEVKKRIEEIYIANYLVDMQSKGSARSQGEASIIQFNFQQKIQELAAKAQEAAQARLGIPPGGALTPEQQQLGGDPTAAPTGAAAQIGEGQPSGTPGAGAGWGDGGQQQPQEQPPQMPGQEAAPQGVTADQITGKIDGWARQLLQMSPGDARMTISEVKSKIPEMGMRLEQAYNAAASQTAGGGNPVPGVEPNMDPLPEQKAPTRPGSI